MPKATKSKAEKLLKQKNEKRWAKGSAKSKKKHGMSLNQLVAARGKHKVGSRERIAIQNSINESLGVAKRHKIAGAPSSKAMAQKEAKKKVGTVTKGLGAVKKKLDTETRPATKTALQNLKKPKGKAKAIAGR